MMLNICEKFRQNGVQLTQSGHEYMVEMVMFKVRRAITPKKKKKKKKKKKANQRYACALHFVS